MKKIKMLTIKEAAQLVEGITEYRVRRLCVTNQIPHYMAGNKYLINQEIFLSFFTIPSLDKTNNCDTIELVTYNNGVQ